MPGSRSASKGGKKKKSATAAPPPPPPTLLRADTAADYEALVTGFHGSALVAVVSPLCFKSTTALVPHLETLNSTRPPLLKDTNLVVIYATDEAKDLCHQLEISALPRFFAYSFGELVSEFVGDNIAKVELIVKMAAQQAQEEIARREAEAKAATAYAAAGATAEAAAGVAAT